MKDKILEAINEAPTALHPENTEHFAHTVTEKLPELPPVPEIPEVLTENIPQLPEPPRIQFLGHLMGIQYGKTTFHESIALLGRKGGIC